MHCTPVKGTSLWRSKSKSKKRVADHGEVFTAEREVNAMLDLVKHETERIDSTFLEKTLSTLIQSVVIFANGRIWPQKNILQQLPQDVFSYSGYKLDLGPILECIAHVLFGVDRSMVKQTAPERCVKFSN